MLLGAREDFGFRRPARVAVLQGKLRIVGIERRSRDAIDREEQRGAVVLHELAARAIGPGIVATGFAVRNARGDLAVEVGGAVRVALGRRGGERVDRRLESGDRGLEIGDLCFHRGDRRRVGGGLSL